MPRNNVCGVRVVAPRKSYGREGVSEGGARIRKIVQRYGRGTAWEAYENRKETELMRGPLCCVRELRTRSLRADHMTVCVCEFVAAVTAAGIREVGAFGRFSVEKLVLSFPCRPYSVQNQENRQALR